MTRFALMRHFPTDWNAERRLQGRTDRPLTDSARAALAGLALPPPWDAADILASPLARARETAELLARGRPVALDPGLEELHYGDWEGRSIDALLADPASGYVPMTEWGWDRRPPGGESPADAWSRIRPVLERLTRPTVIVTHKGVMRVILARAHGWDFDGPEPFGIKRARLYPLSPGGEAGDPVRLVAR